MSTPSKHLTQIISKHNRVANLQVVFADVAKYSKRRTATQTEVIDRFTTCLQEALKRTSQKYITYAQTNDVNFQNDIIKIATGDGAAIVFPFDGLHDIHLFFAKSLLQEIYEANLRTPCLKYDDHGWCNCHPNLAARVGISEGRGIIYIDVNGNYNVAGNAINLAARVMNLIDPGQIAFTDEAYRQIIDMVDDPDLVDRFNEFANIKVKHGTEINVYQYTGEGENYINADIAEELYARQKGAELLKALPTIMADSLNNMGQSPTTNLIERISQMQNLMNPDIDAQKKKRPSEE